MEHVDTGYDDIGNVIRQRHQGPISHIIRHIIQAASTTQLLASY